MPEGKGYKAGYSSTPSKVPTWGAPAGGPAVTTSASNAGNSGRKIHSGPFPRNPKQKGSMSYGKGYRNTTKSGDPGNMGY